MYLGAAEAGTPYLYPTHGDHYEAICDYGTDSGDMEGFLQCQGGVWINKVSCGMYSW